MKLKVYLSPHSRKMLDESGLASLAESSVIEIVPEASEGQVFVVTTTEAHPYSSFASGLPSGPIVGITQYRSNTTYRAPRSRKRYYLLFYGLRSNLEGLVASAIRMAERLAVPQEAALDAVLAEA